jgi:AcrR family transcriptional regulator
MLDAAEKVDTKDRILDAAEALFMEQGLAATSLRVITARGKAKLAAVNYHFGSKEELIRAVFMRRLGPLSRERIVRLDKLDAEANGAALTTSQILEAFVGPALAVSCNSRRGLLAASRPGLRGALQLYGLISEETVSGNRAPIQTDARPRATSASRRGPAVAHALCIRRHRLRTGG